MRFLTLLRKEFWESLPWILLAAIIFFAVGGFCVRGEVNRADVNWRYDHLSPGSIVGYYELTHYSQLDAGGMWLLLLISPGLGLALGIRHFWIPHFTRTWPFLLHRSTKRKTILCAKLTAAIIAFIISIGAVWCVLYWYACQPQLFKTPAPVRIFIEGWIFIAIGFVVYLGTALPGLSMARWYTTKIFGLLFAIIVFFATFFYWRLDYAFAVLIIGAVILLSQIIDTFLNREF
jgi:hypothetical protein